MPTPRRQIHMLVQDAAGTLPTYRKANHVPKRDRHCVRCKCRLAFDQRDEWCSPCQRVMSGTPDNLSLYLSPPDH